MDGKESLPATDGIHTTAIQELWVEYSVNSDQEEECFHRMLPRYNIQDPQETRTFCLYADPRHFHAGISVLDGSDLRLDLCKDVICTHFLGFGGFVSEEEVKNCILTFLKQVGGTVIQEAQRYMGVVAGEGQEDVDSCSLGDIRHGDDLYLAEGSHKVYTACDRFLLARLSRGL